MFTPQTTGGRQNECRRRTLWAQILVGCLLLLSAALTLAAAWGVLRLDDFFKRLHPPGGAWCVALASMLFFSLHDGQLAAAG
jgi:multicomponent K+:H+ antiporter subunit G